MVPYYDPIEFNDKVKDYVESDRGLLIGSLYMAALLDMVFITITTMMTFAYYKRAIPHMSEEKFAIYATYTLGLGSTILGLVYGYDTFVTHYNETFFYLFSTRFDPIFLWFMPLQIAIVQFHLARKAFLICGRNYWVLIYLTTTIVCSVAAALTLFYAVKQSGNAILILSPMVKYSEIAWLSLGALSDISITVTIMYNLMRRKTHFKDTRRQITRLIWLTAETQLIPPILAVVTLVTQAILNNTYTRFCLFFIGGKIYLVSLLFSIGSRDRLQTKPNGVSTSRSTMSSKMYTGHSTDKEGGEQDMPQSELELLPPSGGVMVDVHTEISHDPRLV